MNKKEEFKQFAKMHPELVKHIQNHSMTWQNFYEIYDIYGEQDEAWGPYLKSTLEEKSSSQNSLADKLKNIDADMIQEHINNAQKALGVLSELTGHGSSPESAAAVPKVPRPLNHFFED